MQELSNISMTIGGASVEAESGFDVFNPAKGSVLCQAPSATAEQLDQAVESARDAFGSWRALSIDERRSYVRKCAVALREHAEELAEIFTLEQGRPTSGAAIEIELSAAFFDETADLEMPFEITEDSDTRRVEVHYDPLGVVCAITPWNFPLTMFAFKVAPALLTGNTIVVKPSPFTPLCTLRVGQILDEVLPTGVLNTISGDDGLGPLMTAHQGFDKISFTGSSATGKRVMESASAGLKRVTLELGGNDVAIVMPDVDPEVVAQQLFFGSFFNTAQICVATKRLYVHTDVYDKVRDTMAFLAQSIKVGDGTEPDSVFGPIQNKRQYDRVMNLLNDAKDTGLTLLTGADVPEGDGYFVPITLVDNPPVDSRVVVEEAFGPILPLLRFDDLDQVIEEANDSEFGLAGSVWSKDVDAAVEIAKRLDTGTVWINENLYLPASTPFGGHKQSGIGVEHGMDGLKTFMSAKAIYIPK